MNRSLMTMGILVVMAAGWSCRQEPVAPARAGTGGDSEGRQDRLEVETVLLQGEHFTSAIEASGTALPVRESMLSLPVPGMIKQILVERGQRVNKGQVLLRLDQVGFRLGVEQARAAVAAARVGFASLETQMKRFDRLLANKAVPRANYDKIKAQYDGAAAQLAMAEAGLKQAEKALRDSELRAPYQGEITMILKEIGEYAPAMPPTMLMKIVDSSTLVVQTFLPESESPFVAVGRSAEVHIDSADYSGPARVSFVSPRLEPGSQTFEVRLELDNPGTRIKAGAFCRVRLVRRELEQALLAPLRAVLREGGKDFLYLLEDGRARRVEVKLGETSGDRVLVLEGPQPGARVITSALDRLRPGQAVAAAGRN